jgi:hypothetical protein
MIRVLSAGRLAAVAGLLIASCSKPAPAEGGGPDKPLAAVVGGGGQVVLFEGLPHQLFEGGVLEAERKAKRTTELNGFPFYADPLPLTDADAAALRAVFVDPDTLKPFSGEKKCGGFHPDYAVEWHFGDEQYRCLICFGCSEVKVHGPKSEQRHDLDFEAQRKLETLLKPYRKNRPQPKDR